MIDLGKMRAVLGDPGRLYNIGNGLVLVGGVGGAIIAALGGGADLVGSVVRIANHFFAAPASVALTAATLIFFAGGSAYSRAWSEDGPLPNAALCRKGDILSGIGALILGMGLVMLGDAILAVSAGIIHATGKFGSAWADQRRLRFFAIDLLVADVCKDAVLLSRLPALLAATSGVVSALGSSGSLGPVALALSVVVSTIYWTLADILLLRRHGPLMVGTVRLLNLVRRRRRAAE